MTIAFQEKCPVYSVASNSNRQSTASISSINSTPYPTAASSGIQYPIPNNPSIPYPTTNHTSMPTPNSYMSQQSGYVMPNSNNAYNVPAQTNFGGYQPPYQPFINPSSLQQSTPPIALNNDKQSTNYKGTSGNYGTIQSTHIRASLISAIEDKIRSRLLDKIG